MKHFFYYIITFTIAFAMTSCYEDYIKDNEVTAAYFSSQKPLRTVISDRDMNIKVGVAIGGKREVDMNDWAEFEIDPELLDGTNLVLLPDNYYTLSDPKKMKVSRPTLAVADVTINFTDKFYEDANSTKTYYALPFKVTNSSLSQITEGKSTSIVAIKYISNYHGYYYIQGKINSLNDDGSIKETAEYNNINLSQNDTRLVSTLSRTEVSRQGIANREIKDDEHVKLTFKNNGEIEVIVEGNIITSVEGNGSYKEVDGRLQLTLNYKFKKGADTFSVEETLTRRQDPLKDLRFEEW